MLARGKMVTALLLVMSITTIPAESKPAESGSSSPLAQSTKVKELETKMNEKEAIQKVLDTQAEAWNRGDLSSFMTGYLESPDTSYTSGGAEVWGYDAIQKRFAKTYGTDSSAMGKLSFTNLRIVEVGNDSAFCVGHFHLVKADSSNAEGVFSLVFKKTSHGWKIMHDHTTSGIKKEAD